VFEAAAVVAVLGTLLLKAVAVVVPFLVEGTHQLPVVVAGVDVAVVRVVAV
jgi:hypothetical protein